MKFIKILSILFITLFFSCDKIDIPLKEQTNTCGIDTIPIRKILIEDFTGHKCTNCPDASEILQEIKNNYCDHIVPIAIHVSSFAAPSSEPFTNDYRTDAGNELDDYYEVSNEGLPNGLVNRKKYNNNFVIGKDNWETATNLLFSIPPEVYISIESSYNDDTKEITATLTSKFLFDVDYATNIGLYVTEDSIVSAQLSHTGIIYDYTHRHMLRKAITPTFGESLLPSAFINDEVTKTYKFFADETWDIKHIELVAFVSNSATNEIIQAEVEHLNY
ncbi:MAG: Omp28-related outer membrane protein [Chlorobi bacterium]|nr:Omp28-related outer membrane protein [Chlorobiota bacterium]